MKKLDTWMVYFGAWMLFLAGFEYFVLGNTTNALTIAIIGSGVGLPGALSLLASYIARRINKK